MFDNAPAGIVLIDAQGGVTDCNRAFAHMTGLHRDALLGRAFGDLVAKQDRADVTAQLSKMVMGVQPAANIEARMTGGGEKQLIASLHIGKMTDDAGDVAGMVVHVVDTTEQKDLELQFGQSQKMQAVGQLAGGVAHDFNNLLTAMIGFCDLLLERHGPDDPSFADIMQIQQNANRATNLVRQLLAFSRKQTLQAVVIDPRAALADLSNLLGRLLGETVTLSLDHGPDTGAVRVDPGQFDQVIINLVVNARDAMPGGGTVTISTANVTTTEPIQRGPDQMPPGQYVLIKVSDTGVGIPRENLERIFEPFFSTKEVGAGTGLGLSTVYGIVRQSGGFIVVDSAPGEGTSFGFYFPLARDGDGAAAAPPALPQQAAGAAPTDLTGSGTVLLVEDEDAVRMFGARALKGKGYRVIEAADGEAAIDAIHAHDGPIDLILSDVVMPGMDGPTLVRFVREEMPKIKVILMSGYTEDGLSEDLRRDETIHFLQKPYTLKGLAGKVKAAMES